MNNVIRIYWGMNQAWTSRRIKKTFEDMIRNYPEVSVSEAAHSFIDYMMEEERLNYKVIQEAIAEYMMAA